MDAHSTGRLIYLLILGLALAGWVVVQNRRTLGRVAQQAAVWGLIFVGVIAAFGLWGDIRRDVMPSQNVVADGTRIEVPRAFDGHYYLTLEIDGTPVRFTVDTGATSIVLSPHDAERVGLDTARLAYLGQARTANGIVRTARVTLDELRLGAIADRGVRAYVNEAEMDGSLLGMDYLSRFGRIEIAGGRLILTR